MTGDDSTAKRDRGAPAPGGTAAAEWRVWTMNARLVVTRPGALAAAERLVRAYLDDVDAACSRFRDDSELATLPPGRPTRVSPLLAELVSQALAAARRTDGSVDPTVGGRLCDLGYDRSIAAIDAVDAWPEDGRHDARQADAQRQGVPPSGRAPSARAGHRPGAHHARLAVRLPADWRQVVLTDGVLTVPDGVALDLGATAKAYAADVCARRIADTLDTGAFVSLGGDIATAGPAPAGGWRIRVQDRPGDPACTIVLGPGGALATSSTVSRRWRHDGAMLHHILDPRTGAPADPVWRTVSVASARCIDANAASTATLVRGHDGRNWLRRTGLPARLVPEHGTAVVTIGGWPQEGSP